MSERSRVYLCGGHVFCPVRRADVDVEHCVGCERLREVHDESSPPYLVCDSTTVRGADPDHAAWWFAHHRRPYPR